MQKLKRYWGVGVLLVALLGMIILLVLGLNNNTVVINDEDIPFVIDDIEARTNCTEEDFQVFIDYTNSNLEADKKAVAYRRLHECSSAKEDFIASRNYAQQSLEQYKLAGNTEQVEVMQATVEAIDGLLNFEEGKVVEDEGSL